MDNSEDKVGCLFAIFRLLGLTPRGKTGGAEQLPYLLRDDFLSVAEQAFLGVLRQILPADTMVCPKVRLADLFFVADRRSNQGYVNRIDRKHVDFIVCAGTSARPLFAVELDDASHQREDRAERDRFVDQVFQTAGLPLLHVPAQRAYNLEQLRGVILPLLRPAQTSRPAARAAPVTQDGTRTVPTCGKCGIPMVLRTSSRGPKQGAKFFGCKNYPRCHETIPIDG